MIKMKIYSDYIWPFCYIGKAIVDRLKQKFDIEEEWYGLEIHPETPLEGEDITKKFDRESIDRLYDRLNQPFIINDEYRIVGAQPYEKFEEVLQEIKRSDWFYPLNS